jgi:hypothetical protein
MVTAAGGPQVTRRDDRDARADGQVQPGRLARRGEPAAAARSQSADVVSAEHALGTGLARQPDHLGYRVAAPDDKVSSAPSQREPQVCESLEQEPGPVRRRRGTGQQPVVQDEQRQDRGGMAESGIQRRVVAQPQVPGEQHDRQAHAEKATSQS